MGIFKTKNITVNTIAAEQVTSSYDFARIFINRISEAFTSLSSNWTISDEPKNYLDGASGPFFGGICTFEMYNTLTKKYVRIWWISSYDATTSGLSYNTAQWYACASPKSKPSSYGDSYSEIPIYDGNIVIGLGGYANNSGSNALLMAPSTLVIGIASHSISDNFGDNLNLDIPLFGFNVQNNVMNQSSAGYISSYPCIKAYCQIGTGVTSGNTTSSYSACNYSTKGVNNLVIGTDGVGFYITDKILYGSVSASKAYFCTLYSPELFEPSDLTDTRKDGAYCYETGYGLSMHTFGYLTYSSSMSHTSKQSYTHGFCSYVDKYGAKLANGSISGMDVIHPIAKSVSAGESIIYTPCVPELKVNSYTNKTVKFGNSCASKGKISTEYLRLVDEELVPYGATLDGGKWICLCPGVMFPFDPSNPPVI